MKKIKYFDNEISKLSLGTVQFGLDYGISNSFGKPNDNEVKSIIEYVNKNAINCYDTASGYGDSESRLGKVFEHLDITDEVNIVSKLSSDEFSNDINIVNLSLEKLRIKKLFGLLLHDSKILNIWENSCKDKISMLKNKGYIKYFGVSIYTNDEFEKALNNDFISLIQVPFNVFDQRAIRHKWFEKAKERGKLIFIRSIYLQGLLLMDIDKVPKKLEQAKKYLIELDNISKDLGIKKNELVMSFVDSVAKESVLLFGCENLSQAKENLSNYNNLNFLEDKVLDEIMNKFKDIDESIYLPTKW